MLELTGLVAGAAETVMTHCARNVSKNTKGAIVTMPSCTTFRFGFAGEILPSITYARSSQNNSGLTVALYRLAVIQNLRSMRHIFRPVSRAA